MNALLRIAAIHHNNENWDDAVTAWRNVLDVEPDHRVARRRIQDAIDGQSHLKKTAILSSTQGTVTEQLEMIPTEELDMPPLPEQAEQIVEKPRGTAMDWVDAIDEYIKEHGGVVNQDFRSLGLIPEDITSGERKRMNEELENCFTKHKVNNFRVFYCSPMIIEPDEVQAQYDKCQTQEDSDLNKEDIEFGFGTL